MKQTHLVQLQKEVVQVLGHPVQSISDCYVLVEAIFKKTGAKISVNTLRRFFNLIASQYPPSHNTLLILSNACGFRSFAEFVAVQEARQENEKEPDTRLLMFLISLFEQVPVPDGQEQVFKEVVQLTVSCLKQNPELTELFQKAIAPTCNGQQFYFEHFIQTDYLARHYGEGLRYYLIERKEPEAQVFAHSLLCFRAWLVADAQLFDQHYQALITHTITCRLPPRVFAHAAAARLFHASLSHQPARPVLDEIRNYFALMLPAREHLKNFPRFEYTIIGALVLTEHFEEAIFYITQVAKRRGRYAVAAAEMPLFKGIDLYHALALAALQRPVRAETAYRQLKGATFYFLDQAYAAILMILLERLHLRRAVQAPRLQQLIYTTGFRRFEHWFPVKGRSAAAHMKF